MGPHWSIAFGLVVLGIGVYSQELLQSPWKGQVQTAEWIIKDKKGGQVIGSAARSVARSQSQSSAMSSSSSTGLQPVWKDVILPRVLPVSPVLTRLSRSPRRGGGGRGGGGRGGGRGGRGGGRGGRGGGRGGRGGGRGGGGRGGGRGGRGGGRGGGGRRGGRGGGGRTRAAIDVLRRIERAREERRRRGQ